MFKRYEAEQSEDGTYYGVIAKYPAPGKPAGARLRVTEGHATADGAARTAYAMNPQRVRTPDGVRELSFEEANGMPAAVEVEAAVDEAERVVRRSSGRRNR